MATIRMFDNFSCGVVYGIIAAGIIWLVIGQIRSSNKKIGLQHRTLDTFSDSEKQNLSAAKIVRNSLLGTLGCIFWTVVLFWVFYLLWCLGFALKEFCI
jgi:hypothetical protein